MSSKKLNDNDAKEKHYRLLGFLIITILVSLGFNIYLGIKTYALKNDVSSYINLPNVNREDQHLIDTSWELLTYYKGKQESRSIETSSDTFFFLDFDSSETYTLNECENGVCDVIKGRYMRGMHNRNRIVFNTVSAKDSISAKISNECGYGKCNYSDYMQRNFPISKEQTPAFLQTQYYQIRGNKLYFYNGNGELTLIYAKRSEEQ